MDTIGKMNATINALYNLSAPWVTYYKKVKAIFDCDPEVHVDFSYGDKNGMPVLTIRVDNETKADAIAILMPEEEVYGNVSLKIKVIPPNGEDLSKKDTLFKGDNITMLDAVKEVLSSVSFGDFAAKKTITKDTLTDINWVSIFEEAFKGNDVLSFTKVINDPIITNKIIYIVFKNEVVQFFNDDMSDIYGNCNTLYEEIARDIFYPIDNVYYCTDMPKGSVSNNMAYADFINEAYLK